MARTLPFTWQEYELAIGRTLTAEIKGRLDRCAREPTAQNWKDARSIVVAPQASIMGQTLWQCAEAITLTRIPDGQVPGQSVITRALCYAAGLPYPQGRR
jgi:hypothetical protein